VYASRLLGTLAAFNTAAFAIRWMSGHAAHHDVRVFAAHRVVARVLILLVFPP
jgi:undecaprenyl pyrophosphate phosphatase UppP